MPAPLEASYHVLSVEANRDMRGSSTTESLVACVRKSLELLADLDRIPLVSKVANKTYFAFKATLPKLRISRGINVTKDGDKKSPGTFFENFVGHLVASTFGANPTKTITAPTLDIEISIPTDFIFDLGPGKSRIHLPVKASTRERVIQVWAHQRVLDGMHGMNRFRGLLVVLAETNRQGTTSITEVCLPKQWTAYQMYIAQMHRVYYLDVPDKYRSLREQYPFLEVKAFADFFYEHEEIAQPSVAIIDLVDPSGPTPALVGLPEDDEV